MIIKIWTDGSYNRHNNKAAWGYVIKCEIEGNDIYIEDSKPMTQGKLSNNTAEMMAVLNAIRTIKNCMFEFPDLLEHAEVEIFSDSQYCVIGLTEWIHGWKKIGFQGKKNSELWKVLYEEFYKHSFKKMNLYWVRGHDTCEENIRCDEMCGYYTSTKSPLNAK